MLMRCPASVLPSVARPLTARAKAFASCSPPDSLTRRAGAPALARRAVGSCQLGLPTSPSSPTPIGASKSRLLTVNASAFGGSGDAGSSSSFRAGPLALAAGTALGLFLGSVVNDGPLLLPPGPWHRPAHAEAAALQQQEVPLTQRKDPMTMQLPETEQMQGLSPEETRTIGIFQRNTPSVVNITNIQAVRKYGFPGYSLDNDKVPAGSGSGFVWDSQGRIVTNFHVIQGADEVKVTLLDQSTYTAKVVGGDADKDIAVLQLLDIPADKMAALQPVSIGVSSKLLVGQRVFAIGNPFGLDHTLTSGIISGLGRELATNYYTIKGVIQTDAAINPGNSGGILLDSQGKVIGINTAIADPTGKGASSGVGFAIPVDTVKGLVDQILTYGRVIRPVLGVTIAPPQLLRQLGQDGVLVLEVPRNSPAEAAGIKPSYRDPASGAIVLGDIITGVDGKHIENYTDLTDALDTKRVGDVVQVEVLRSQDGGSYGTAKKLQLSVKLGERGQLTIAE